MNVLTQKLNNLINVQKSLSPSRSDSENSKPPLKAREKKRGRWTSEEDVKLKAFAPIYSEKQWRKISDHIPGRSAIQCLHRWTKILKPGLIKGPWTQEEDNKLLDWVKKEGPTKWAQLSNLIQGRSGKQCRERWFNNLDPDVKKGNWAVEEDDLIFKLYLKHGSSWSKIASFLPGRTENSVKNRFYSTIRKIATDKKKEEGESLSLLMFSDSETRSTETRSEQGSKPAGATESEEAREREKSSQLETLKCIKVEETKDTPMETENDMEQCPNKLKSQSLYNLLQNRADILTACSKRVQAPAEEGGSTAAEPRKAAKKGPNKRRREKSPASLSSTAMMEEIRTGPQAKPLEALSSIQGSVQSFLSMTRLDTCPAQLRDPVPRAPCLKKRNIIITTNDDLARCIKKEQEEKKFSLLLHQLRFLEQMLCNTKQELTRLESSLSHQPVSRPGEVEHGLISSASHFTGHENMIEFLDLSNTLDVAKGDSDKAESRSEVRKNAVQAEKSGQARGGPPCGQENRV